MTSRFISRRRFLQAASGAAVLGVMPYRLANAHPVLLAIVPAVITGVFGLLSAHVQVRERQKSADAELMRARETLVRYRERQMRREFEDRQRQDRNALVVAWIKAGVEAGMIDHK
ncbi:MAG: twin-arginine translocation signal domain-containing protein, partial [Rhodocyclaceae bacterium]